MNHTKFLPLHFVKDNAVFKTLHSVQLTYSLLKVIDLT